MLLVLALSLFSLLGVATAAPAPLVMLKDPRARCLDGSQGGYYIQTSATHPTRFILHLQGGGECDTQAACHTASLSYLGSSKYFTPTLSLYLLNADDCTANPDFCDWVHVHVAYCSQDLHSGLRTTPTPETFNLYFSGAHIVHAVLDDLTARYGLGAATDVILTGDSAGGIATWLHVDALAARLPAARTVAVPVAGFYFYAYPYTGPNRTSSVLVDFSPANWPRLIALWNATADATCVRALTSSPWACMLANYSLPYIAAPVFAAEAQTDKVVILDHDSIPQQYITQPPELAYVTAWSHNMSAALSALKSRGAGHGFFSPACFIHTDFHATSPLINGENFYAVVGRWYFGRPGQVFVADDCGVFCNPSCAHP